MVKIVKPFLYAKWGQSNVVHGTNRDDYIVIKKNMETCGNYASNLIHLHNGADKLVIGGKMKAHGGENTIIGNNGVKSIAIEKGMSAKSGGVNKILLHDNIAHFTVRHNLEIDGVLAEKGGKNIISTGDGDDRIVLTGHHFKAYHSGENIISLGNGSKDVKFVAGMSAHHGGQNTLKMGMGNQNVTFDRDVDAGHGSTNNITSDGGNVSLHIRGNLEAKGLNNINIGGGKTKLIIDGNIVSHHKGSNSLVFNGETDITVGGAMKTHHGLNQIQTSVYNDQVTITKGLYAHGGTNSISTGAGNDTVTIKGYVKADWHSTNTINTGSGNDVINLDAAIGRKALVIDAGSGYDVLNLSAKNAHQFKSNYQDWFADMAYSQTLSTSSIEEVRVDIDSAFGLRSIDWLTKIVNNYNATHSNDISINLALDEAGSHLDISDIFTPRDESSIKIIDLTGHHANELHIGRTLTFNGYDANELRVDGDSQDSVSIGRNWFSSGGTVHENENYYSVWHNRLGETLLVQDGIDIHVY